MKTRLVKVAVIVVFLLAAWRIGQAQSQVAQFRFTVQRTATGVKMECSLGCAWKDLSFSLAGDATQAVDGMGMVKK